MVARKRASKYLVIAIVLLLLAVFIFSPMGAGPGALRYESTFYPSLQNSLYYLDEAKDKWAEEKHKPDGAIPTMDDLTPYLGDDTNRIKHFVALGIEYKISPLSELDSQSDVATLTRDLRFQAGFCRYYPAGTSYSIRTGWSFPHLGIGPSLLAYYHNDRGSIVIVLFVVAVGSLMAFVIKKNRRFDEHHSPRTLSN